MQASSSYKDYIAKAPQVSGNRTMIFRVKILYDKSTFRDIELASEGTLEDLHLMIQQAFNFDNEHLYAFFLDKKRWSRYTEVDAREQPAEPGIRKAHEVSLSYLILQPKQKFLYIFDFGDEWLFEVEFIGTGMIEKNKKYPRIIKVKGESPKQYEGLRTDQAE